MTEQETTQSTQTTSGFSLGGLLSRLGTIAGIATLMAPWLLVRGCSTSAEFTALELAGTENPAGFAVTLLVAAPGVLGLALLFFVGARRRALSARLGRLKMVLSSIAALPAADVVLTVLFTPRAQELMELRWGAWGNLAAYAASWLGSLAHVWATGRASKSSKPEKTPFATFLHVGASLWAGLIVLLLLTGALDSSGEAGALLRRYVNYDPAIWSQLSMVIAVFLIATVWLSFVLWRQPKTQPAPRAASKPARVPSSPGKKRIAPGRPAQPAPRTSRASRPAQPGTGASRASRPAKPGTGASKASRPAKLSTGPAGAGPVPSAPGACDTPQPVHCASCGEATPPGTFCSWCGAPLAEKAANVTKCPACEADLAPGTKFCVWCGAAVSKPPAQAAQQPGFPLAPGASDVPAPEMPALETRALATRVPVRLPVEPEPAKLERHFEQPGQPDQVLTRLGADLGKVGVEAIEMDVRQGVLVGVPPSQFLDVPGAARLELTVEPAKTPGKASCTMRVF